MATALPAQNYPARPVRIIVPFAPGGSPDVLARGLGAQLDAQLGKSFAIYNQPAAPAWRWLDLSKEHAVWTFGQLIPYLRLNKVTPPPYDMPF